MNNQLIWVLEDDSGVQFVYEEILSHNFKLLQLESLAEFKTALSFKESSKPSLILADLRLKDDTFLSFLSSSDASLIKDIPLIVISSLDDAQALHQCFQAGALDYITKPFGKQELLFKIQRFFNPANKSQSSALTYKIDPLTLRVHTNGIESEPLTSRELQLMTLFIENFNQKLSRKDILRKVWGNVTVSPKTLDVHLVNLRKKIAVLRLGINFINPHFYQLTDKVTEA